MLILCLSDRDMCKNVELFTVYFVFMTSLINLKLHHKDKTRQGALIKKTNIFLNGSHYC